MLSLFPPPGPCLPPFSSLFVKGQYHTSALLHLAIGHVLESPQHEVLILSPSPPRLEQRLVSGIDQWLHSYVTLSKIRAAMSRILILYPPTPAHLSLLIAALGGSQPITELLDLWDDLAILPTEKLSMIIVDEISEYYSNSKSTSLLSFENSFISLMNRLMQSAARVAANPDYPNSLSLACFEASALGSHCPGGSDDHSPHAQSVIASLFQWVFEFKAQEVIQVVPSSQEDEPSHPSSESQVRKVIRALNMWESESERQPAVVEYTEILARHVDSQPVLQFLWE